MSIHIFENEELLYSNLKNEIELKAKESIKERGFFTLAISGGSLLKYLNNIKVEDAEKYYIFFADERHVPLDHPDANYFQAAEFLDQFDNEKVFVPSPVLTCSESAIEYGNRLKLFFNGSQNVKLDLVLLGIGTDGHTASLFPGHSSLHSTELVISETNSPKLPKERVSLGLDVLDRSDVLFVVQGEAKKDILLQIFESSTLPASRIKGNVKWFVDRLAALEIASRVFDNTFK